MLHVHTMILGAYQTNCYLAWGEGSDRCVVIDPGYEPEAVLAQAAVLGKSVEAILLTHGHFDHVGGVKQIAADTGCRVYLCEQDLSMPPQLTAGSLYYTHTYGEGDILTLAGVTFRVLHTPGHTPGSVCLLAEDVLFSGDTLFAGSCGRTDLPGGSWETLMQSLARLARLEGDLTVYPGHAESTTLDREKRWNPYLKGVL